MAKVGALTGDGSPMREAVRTARLTEAAHRDAANALSDAKTLRLLILKDEIAAVVAATPTLAEDFDIALQAGEPPRLWLDLITAVVMDPDPRTYRLVEDRRDGRSILFETADRGEMLGHIKDVLAHRIIARERRKAEPGPAPVTVAGYSQASLVLAWLAGLALGALGLLSVLIYMKLLIY